MAVGTYAAKKQIDAAVGGNLRFVALTFLFGVFGIAVEDIDILGPDVDMAEEVGPHEGMVALLMVAGDTAVLVHVEGDNVPERNFALFIQPDKLLLHA